MAADSLKGALLNIQKKAPKVQKDGLNPHLGSKYMTLDSVVGVVLDLLNEESVVFTGKLSMSAEGRPTLKYSFYHVPTKETDSDEAPLMLLKASPQDLGSAVTYTRRYVLVTYLNLVTDQDDDGHAGTRAARSAHNEATKPATLPPAQTERTAVVTIPTGEAEAKLREAITRMATELKTDHADQWAKVLAWAAQDGRKIDVENPGPSQLRALEGSLRRKVDAVRATAAKKAAETAVA